MTSESKLKLGESAIGGEHFGEAGGEAERSRNAVAEDEVRQLLEHEAPHFDLSRYANYETTERGWRFGFAMAFLAMVWLFLEVFAMLLFASRMGATKAAFLGLALFIVVMIGWGALYFGRQAALGDRGLVAWFWDGFFRDQGEAPPIDEAPAQLLRIRGRPREALKEYERLREQNPGVALVLFRMAEIHQKDLKSPTRAADLYRQFITAAAETTDEQEIEAAAWAEVQLAELERG